MSFEGKYEAGRNQSTRFVLLHSKVLYSFRTPLVDYLPVIRTYHDRIFRPFRIDAPEMPFVVSTSRYCCDRFNRASYNLFADRAHDRLCHLSRAFHCLRKSRYVENRNMVLKHSSRTPKKISAHITRKSNIADYPSNFLLTRLFMLCAEIDNHELSTRIREC